MPFFFWTPTFFFGPLGISTTIRIGQEILCLQYAGFYLFIKGSVTNMLLINAYMNLHYAVSKVWSQSFTQFAFMALFG